MIETLAALYVLAILDTMFSGICAASGRNALIEKRVYYLRSMVYGFVWGQAACIVALLILYVVAMLSEDRDRTILEMIAVGQRMATVYSIYAAIVLATFAVRAIPSVDVRSITSVVGFGPLTLIRPAVILAGLAWGLALMPSMPVAIAAILIALIMIPFRVWLNWMIELHGVGVLQPRDLAISENAKD
jgi:hypothetical protein